MRVLGFILMMVVAAVAHAEPAQAPKAADPVSSDPQATSATYGDWVLLCQRLADEAATRLCEVSQSVQVQGQPGPIARLAVGISKEPAEVRVTVVLPTNVLLTEKPKAALGEGDADAVSLDWVRCLPGGCFADAKLKDDVLGKWRAATDAGRLDFADGAGRLVSVPFSFRGLAPAFDALKKE